MSTQKKIAFVDRDGTLIYEPADKQVDRLDKVALLPGVIPALLKLKSAGYEFVMVTNQDGLGTASFPEEDFRIAQDFTLELFASQGIEFAQVFVCPHRDEDACACRKPKTGLLDAFMRSTELDRSKCFVVGDRETDVELAKNLGLPGILIDPDDPQAWSNIVAGLLSTARQAQVKRRTKETDIDVRVDLDREDPIDVATGIGFFDHMLEQIAKHGGFALTLSCQGDLQVDEHHTVEDTGLALGEALRQALGDKLGIARYGFLLPMDEARAQVAMDLSNRPYFVFEGDFPRAQVGELPTEMVTHFFRSLSESLRAALHISVQGENTHHMVEACFKATGRAIRQAKAREGTQLPTTKGSL